MLGEGCQAYVRLGAIGRGLARPLAIRWRFSPSRLGSHACRPLPAALLACLPSSPTCSSGVLDAGLLPSLPNGKHAGRGTHPSSRPSLLSVVVACGTSAEAGANDENSASRTLPPHRAWRSHNARRGTSDRARQQSGRLLISLDISSTLQSAKAEVGEDAQSIADWRYPPQTTLALRSTSESATITPWLTSR